MVLGKSTDLPQLLGHDLGEQSGMGGDLDEPLWRDPPQLRMIKAAKHLQ